jgi:mRNA interferase MazF
MMVVCFITSVPRTGPDMAAIAPTPGTGLKVPSVVRLDKIATLDLAVVTGQLGDAPAEWLAAHSATFFGVFGFASP